MREVPETHHETREQAPGSASSVTQADPIVVIGAGYAGVTAANRIRARFTASEAERWPVTLVSPEAYLVDRVRLHEVAAGTLADARVPLDGIVHPGVRRIRGTVSHIDHTAKQLHLAPTPDTPQPASIRYSGAIIAVGSGADGAAPDPAWHGVHSLAAAERLRAALAAGGPTAVTGQEFPVTEVRVIGGGTTGVELSAELASSPDPLRVSLWGSASNFAGIPGRGQLRLQSILAGLGVALRPGVRVDTSVTERERAHTNGGGGRAQPGDGGMLTVWAGSLAVPALGRASGLPVDEAGRIQTDETLQAQGMPGLYAAGDAAVVQGARGQHLRMSCAAAIPLGGHAADNLLAQLRGVPQRPVDVGFFQWCISLGREQALLQPVSRGDRPTGFALTGAPAVWMKRWICRGILRWPAREAQRPGSAPRIPAPRTAREAR